MRQRLVDLFFSVRMRTTVAATVIVGLALVAGAFVLVHQQEVLLTQGVDDSLDTRTDDLVTTLESERDVTSVDVAKENEALVQAIDEQGRVVVSSDNVAGEPPVVTAEQVNPSHEQFSTTDGLPLDTDERFRVRTEVVDTPVGPLTVVVAASLEPVDDSIDALTGNLIIAIPVLLLLVAVIAWFVLGRALHPVDAIRAEVDTITDDRLDRRVPESRSRDEVGKLARTMNVMLARLQSAWDRQERFVADASHELRSPLTAMRSQLEVDLEHPETADRAVTEAEVLTEIDNLEGLIDDLLYLARSDADAPRPAQAVDLDDIVLREADRRRRTSDVVLNTSRVSAGQVTGSRRDLQRLVGNLLDNAVRHADAEVRVSLSEGDGRVELVVADDGPGIPAEARERVFERFARLDQSRGRDSGTGLGLAIAHDIVDRHRGRITVDPTAERGARIVVELQPSNGMGPTGG